MLNLFTQTFHALAYVFILGTTRNVTNDWILAIVGITFLFKADEILKNILGMDGSATVQSPAASMAKAAVAVGVVNKVANLTQDTASKLVEGHRLMRESRTMGYKGFVGFKNKETRNEIRDNGVDLSFGAMAALQSQNTPKPPEEPLVLNPDTLGDGGDIGDDNADLIAGLMADAADANLYDDGSDNLTEAMGVVLDNPGSPDMARAYERQGLTDDGDKSAKQVAKVAAETQKEIMNLDTNDPNY